MIKIYAAFNSVPDYTAPAPSLRSLHESLDGAKKALYPDREDFRNSFREYKPGVWDGPDGFGLIRLMEVLP
jgi:hypothetical protein